MTRGGPRRTVIVGGGSAGWMTAAALSRFLGRDHEIVLVESDAIGTIGVGEATIPGIRLFNAALGIDEHEFLAATAGTYKLGIVFEGWGAPGDRYIHAFGGIGRALGPIDFFPYWLRASDAGAARSLWDYVPAAVAAFAGRGGRPEQPRDIAWAYHFDAGLYAAFLRRRAERQGVVRREGRIAAVERRADGDVAALVMENGERIAGDLFIDCSGFAALLTADEPFEDYGAWLPCDRAVAVPAESTTPRPAYTRAIARDWGWQWQIPLQHRTGNGLVYASGAVSDDEATATLLANLDAPASGDPRLIRFRTGRRRTLWSGNHVAIGLSAGFLEPLESTSLHLIQQGIAELVRLFPASGDYAAERAAYNRRMAFEFDTIRDFIIAHYHLNGRDGAIWRAARDMPLPDTLAERIALFRESGRIERREEELFAPPAWYQVLTGQHVAPAHWHPVADAVPATDLADFMHIAARDARHQGETMPDHDGYLARFAAAKVFALCLFALVLAALMPDAAVAQAYRDRLPQDEVIYFVLPDRFENGDPANDRGGLSGGRMTTGFDPTAKGFYHGGDLKGLTRRLPYIQSLGATAIWVGPIFKNKPVQGGPGKESAGYHGYWITDFTTVDPHFGTEADFRAFVDAAHGRGMKVYMDIIVNHTADVIQYRECAGKAECAYRSLADFPFQRRGGPAGRAINPGFAGLDVGTAANFAKLTDPTFAYTPFVPPAEATVKVPAWLNDVRLYHNRGDTTFLDESATLGDFIGLDDLQTEDPRVIAGMIDIFAGWIDRFGIDGYRIDTARHVDPAFWRAFIRAIEARAKARGIRNFHIFGEVAWDGLDVGMLARHTIVDRFPAVLDFATRRAILDAVSGKLEPNGWNKYALGDALYADGERTAAILPTFVSNHDTGRVGYHVRQALPGASDGEILQRVMLSHAMLLTLRGVPTIYSGDEQGFAGDGNDQDAREDMFASRVASYNDNRLLDSRRTTATANFATTGPLFREIATLAKLRRATPALSRGRQMLRKRDDRPGLVAFSRFDPVTNAEVVIAFNTAASAVSGAIPVEVASLRFKTLAGRCDAKAQAPGSYAVTLPPFGYAVCAAEIER